VALSQADRDKVTLDTMVLLRALVVPVVAVALIEAIAAWLFGLRSSNWQHAGVGILIAVACLSIVGAIWLNKDLKHENR
jgi:predicted exporter